MTDPSASRFQIRVMMRVTAAVVLAGMGLLSVHAALGGAIRTDSNEKNGEFLRVLDPAVVVLKSERRLHLFDGNGLVRTYEVDLGVEPSGPKRRREDGRTPTGRFSVVTKNPRSPYHRFIGIDYPDAATAESGLAVGLVSPGEALSIRRSLLAGHRPNWRTPLGGGIGLHGHRQGRDWTGGCVALSDPAIEELYRVLRLGDPIEILP
ncbi:MAG: murein L,D-transpeptidase family protein [Phycisphaerae bacterium]